MLQKFNIIVFIVNFFPLFFCFVSLFHFVASPSIHLLFVHGSSWPIAIIEQKNFCGLNIRANFFLGGGGGGGEEELDHIFLAFQSYVTVFHVYSSEHP